MSIPARFAKKDFKPTKRDKIKTVRTDQLIEGMVVLLADSKMRFAYNESDLANTHNQRVTSRWCKVTNLKKKGETVSFIPVYHDGALERRYHNQRIEWYAKCT